MVYPYRVLQNWAELMKGGSLIGVNCGVAELERLSQGAKKVIGCTYSTFVLSKILRKG